MKLYQSTPINVINLSPRNKFSKVIASSSVAILLAWLFILKMFRFDWLLYFVRRRTVMATSLPAFTMSSEIGCALAIWVNEPNDRRLDIAHLVIYTPSLRSATHVHVQKEGDDGRQGATDCERCQCLIHPADSNAGSVVPSCLDAAVTEGPG